MGACLIAGLLAGAAGCGSSLKPGATTPKLVGGGSASELPVHPVVWSACAMASTLQCGTVTVPVDYRHPRAAAISIAVTRARATGPADPHRTLVFNPGGPGESGNQILPVLLGLVPVAVRRSFDIVSFDPRGPAPVSRSTAAPLRRRRPA